MALTFGQFKQRGLERADMARSEFVSGSHLDAYANASLRELHGRLVTRYEDHLTSPTPTEFELTGSASIYQLPSDFMKLRGLDRDDGGWLSVRPFKLEERDRFQPSSAAPRFGGRADVRYRLMGGCLAFAPEGECAGSYRFRYVPRYVDKTSDSDVVHPALEQFAELAVCDLAIKLKDTEDSDCSVLLMQLAKEEQRLEREATNYDAGEPEFVPDVAWGEDWP